MAVKRPVTPPKPPARPAPQPAAKSAPAKAAPAPSRPASSPSKPSAPASSPSRPPTPGALVGLLSKQGPVTQHYGQQSQYDVFSKNVSPAFEVGIPVGTKLSAPPGTWQVVQSYAGANPNGHIGDFSGQGWGNNVRLKNTQTGETIGFNHMSAVNVKPGQTISGGSYLGDTGKSGNATGPHVAITYADKNGRVGNFENSAYMQYLYGGIKDQGGNQQPLAMNTPQQGRSPQSQNIPSPFNPTSSMGNAPIPSPLIKPMQSSPSQGSSSSSSSGGDSNDIGIIPSALAPVSPASLPESTQLKRKTPYQIVYGGQDAS